MTDLTTLGKAESIEAVSAMTTKEELRAAADSIDLTYSGNTGVDTLKTKLLDILNDVPDDEELPTPPEDADTPIPSQDDSTEEKEEEEEPIQVAPPLPPKDLEEDLMSLDPTLEPDPNKRRVIIRAQALALVRVRVTNLDAADADLTGAIITANSKYTGKVSKYIPFGEEAENGYHIPRILLNVLKEKKYPQRKLVKTDKFGVKKYRTSMVHKYAIEELPPLSKEEMEDLAALQRASGAIDN